MGRGSRGASSGSQRCSCARICAPSVRRGRRATSSSPTRNITLSHPFARNSTGWPARSGCWPASRRPTSPAETSTSAAGIGLAIGDPDRRERLYLDPELRVDQAAHPDQGTGRRLVRAEVLVADGPEGREVGYVGEEDRQLHDVV